MGFPIPQSKNSRRIPNLMWPPVRNKKNPTHEFHSSALTSLLSDNIVEPVGFVITEESRKARPWGGTLARNQGDPLLIISLGRCAGETVGRSIANGAAANLHRKPTPGREFLLAGNPLPTGSPAPPTRPVGEEFPPWPGNDAVSPEKNAHAP